MLVLTRKVGQKIVIGDDIEVTICDSTPGRIRIGITAPKSLPVHRRETYDRIQRQKKTVIKDAM